jgi:L-fuconolactonase
VIVDAHHHLWDPALADYPWMTDEVAAIRRRFGPDDLEPLLREHGIDGTVLVQARSSLDETRWLLELADAAPFVRGVVGWIDLTDPDAAGVLAELGGGRLVGIRHQVHDEPDPEWLLRPDVQRGIAAVGAADLAYDFLVRARELPAALETARAQPGVRFVVDHLAKPPVRDGSADAWAEELAAIARLPNVSCKLSGLVTEADWNGWRREELAPYLQRALDWFGPERSLFGSDWPVCLLAADYGSVLDLLHSALDGLDEPERAAVLGETAVRVYHLEETA